MRIRRDARNGGQRLPGLCERIDEHARGLRPRRPPPPPPPPPPPRHPPPPPPPAPPPPPPPPPPTNPPPASPYAPGRPPSRKCAGTPRPAPATIKRMTTLKSKLQEDLTAAVKERDELRSSTLRLTLAAITKEEVAGKTKRELSDDEVLKVITKEAKKRREAADAFDEGGRAESAQRERAEGKLLEAYLPQQLSA